MSLPSHMSPLDLLLVVEDSSDDNVLERLVWVKAEPFGDGLYSLWTKVPLGVHVHHLHRGGKAVSDA